MFTVCPMFIHGTMQYLLDSFQDICACEKQAKHRNGCIGSQYRIRTSYNEKLGDEAVESGQAKGCHAGKDQNAAIDRHKREQSTKLFEVASMCAFIDHAHQEEHSSCR